MPGPPSLDMLVALGRLDPREREAVVEHLLRGQTFAAVGRMMGVSRERARQLVHKGLKQLREDPNALRAAA